MDAPKVLENDHWLTIHVYDAVVHGHQTVHDDLKRRVVYEGDSMRLREFHRRTTRQKLAVLLLRDIQLDAGESSFRNEKFSTFAFKCRGLASQRLQLP